ncbi:MAG: hypothetical protein AAGB26_12085 [Planctomycetota bacterium]
MRVVLGILLTIIAGLIGATSGLITALILSGLILILFGDHNGPIWDLLFLLVFWVLIGTGALAGIAVGWYGLLRRPRTIIDALDPKLCLECGYDLSWNETGRCPECGKGIDRDQHRYLQRLNKTCPASTPSPTSSSPASG